MCAVPEEGIQYQERVCSTTRFKTSSHTANSLYRVILHEVAQFSLRQSIMKLFSFYKASTILFIKVLKTKIEFISQNKKNRY